MILIHNATIVNEGHSYRGSVVIEDENITKIFIDKVPEYVFNRSDKVIEADDLYLIPGVIDDQVHFRDPGLTHKGDIYTESRAAVAGGVTSFMDMPNTIPQTISIDALHAKFETASEKSISQLFVLFGSHQRQPQGIAESRCENRLRHQSVYGCFHRKYACGQRRFSTQNFCRSGYADCHSLRKGRNCTS